MAHLILTVPHHQGQPLAEVLKGFGKARFLMRNRKPWRKMAGRIGLTGSIRGLEVTYGENGWHVHSHEGLFLPSGFYRVGKDDPWADPMEEQAEFWEMLELQDDILRMWQSACLSAGLDVPGDHGVRLQDGRQAAKYLSKWGLDSELTKAHVKQGKEGNLTPFDLLREIKEGRSDLRPRFKEFAVAFLGKRQLTWSDGMRKLLGLEEVEDQEIAGQVEEDEVFYASLTRPEWFLVYSTENRGELIEVAIAGGREGVHRFIAKLVGRCGNGN